MDKKQILILLVVIFIVLLLFMFCPKKKSFMEEEKIYSQNGEAMNYEKIPKQIFLTLDKEYSELPQIIKDNIENTKSINPEYKIRYYSNSDAEKFIEENFPEYLDDYNTLIPGAYKADLFRLLLLYKYGGVYNDIGHVYLKPIHKFISENETLVVCAHDLGSPSDHLYNGIIASVNDHPVIKKSIDIVIENIRNRYHGRSALEPTGPISFAKAFNLHFERNPDEPIDVGMFNEKTKIIVHNKGFVEDIDGTQIIKLKFNNYYEIVYPQGKDKGYYDNLWNQKKIYKSLQ